LIDDLKTTPDYVDSEVVDGLLTLTR
jgi:hypothetical protein